MTSIPPFLRNFSLEKRTIILTGGTGGKDADSIGWSQSNTATGIGLGLCQALAESGADVVSLQLPTEPIENKVSVALMLSNFD
jgi:NAD(P)-dependent dehydrogenase (short-subunit alcohol dehydrogenase family)